MILMFLSLKSKRVFLKMLEHVFKMANLIRDIWIFSLTNKRTEMQYELIWQSLKLEPCCDRQNFLKVRATS